LKGFPKKFTNVPLLLDFLNFNGFSCKSIYIFERRGDFGDLNFKNGLDLDLGNIFFYEWLLIAEKKAERSSVKRSSFTFQDIGAHHSKTILNRSKKLGHTSLKQYFNDLSVP
jgi:hypothetical protein